MYVHFACVTTNYALALTSTLPGVGYVIPDGAKKGAYDEAMKGVDYCVHTAGPYQCALLHNLCMTFLKCSVVDITNAYQDLYVPLVDGAATVLSAAKSEPTVKHLVLTSSVAAIMDLNKGCNAGYEYSEKDWNPASKTKSTLQDLNLKLICRFFSH